MPVGDITGPQGLGPMTGRGMGYWGGFPTPGYMNPGFGRWLPWFCLGGRGRGYRWWFRATGLPFWARWMYFSYPPFYGAEPEKANEAELEFLKQEVRNLERALDGARKRMEELERKEK